MKTEIKPAFITYSDIIQQLAVYIKETSANLYSPARPSRGDESKDAIGDLKWNKTQGRW